MVSDSKDRFFQNFSSTLLAIFTIASASGNADARTSVDLKAPIASILEDLSITELPRALKELCPEYSVNDPIERFLTAEFFEKCLPPARYKREARSPFFAPGSGLEYHVKSTLTPYWLGVNMTPEDIASYRAGKIDIMFTPLANLKYSSFSGRKRNPGWLKHHGMFSIRDFLARYDAELTLPEVDRWIENYRERYDRVLPIRRGIETAFVKATMADDPPVATLPHIDPDVLKQWLEVTRDQHDKSSILARACEDLLGYIQNQVSP